MTSLAQIVAALSVTYDDAGVAIWLGSRNRGLGGAAPIDVIARDPLDGMERVAHLVRAIGDADAGERDTAALDHCDSCHRPLPHNEAEQTACPGTPGLVSNESPFGPCSDPVADPGQPLTCGPCGFDLAEHRPQPDNHRSNR